MNEGAPGGEHDENAMTYRDFTKLDDDELRRRVAAPEGYETFRHYGIEDYQQELRRREVAQQNARLEWLIWALVSLTIVLALGTIVLLWIEFRAAY